MTAGSLTQAIRNFAKSLEGWLKTAMQGIPEEMIKAKVGRKTPMEHIGLEGVGVIKFLHILLALYISKSR